MTTFNYLTPALSISLTPSLHIKTEVDGSYYIEAQSGSAACRGLRWPVKSENLLAVAGWLVRADRNPTRKMQASLFPAQQRQRGEYKYSAPPHD